MKRSYTWKVVLIIAIIALAILGVSGKEIRRGIDLRGGAELLFKIDESKVEGEKRPTLTEDTVRIIRERIDPTGEKGLIIQAGEQGRILMQLPGFGRDETNNIINLAKNMGKLQWRLAAKPDENKVKILLSGKKLPGYAYYKYNETTRAFYAEKAKKEQRTFDMPEGILVRTDDEYNITGELLKRVYSATDRTGRRAVGFELKPEGARRFLKLTSDHKGEQLAIILNDQLYSAPTIEDKIAGQGIITGTFSPQEQDMLIKALNSGSLKAPLILESEQFVGPTLGAHTVQSGIKAGIIAGICVLVFIFVYYLAAGAIANVALCMNILILLAVMAVSRATLTLPGIAGIVLTIGIAVDANVLIFERIREELRLGRELPVAIRMGYEKAFSAIFDSNLTTFATAAILYAFGTGPVRGFAITLSIGILVSFFTAVFVTRVVVELLVKYGLVKKLAMLHLLTRSAVPFMSYARFAGVASLGAIVAGMWLFAQRGSQNLDIDFLGGSVANLVLNEDMSINEVRRRMEEAGFKDVKVQALASKVVLDEASEGPRGSEDVDLLGRSKAFALRVQLAPDLTPAEVQKALGQAFRGALAGAEDFASVKSEKISDRDSAFFGGIFFEARLEKPLPAAAIATQVAAAGFEEADVRFYEAPEGDAVWKDLPENSAEVTGFTVRIKATGAGALQNFEAAVGRAFQNEAGKRVISLIASREPSVIRAVNDPFHNGIRFDGRLTEPLPAAKIQADLAAAGLPRHAVKFYELDEDTAALVALDDNAEAVSILSLDVADITAAALKQKLDGIFALPNPFPDRISQIGPQVASEMAANAIIAILFAMGFIVIYIWFRFGRIRYGVAAVVALCHDVLITLAAIAVGDTLGGTAIGNALMLGDFKINLPVVAALLTIVGYSLNDTIVVFDRIRENMRLKTKSDWEIITGSINQTLGRTLLTSLTTLVVLVIMYIFGGRGIHSFAYVMLVGVIAGTYSSIFIASPVLLLKDVVRGEPIAQKAAGK